MNDEDNPFDGYEPMFSKDDIEGMAERLRKQCEAKKVDVNEEKLKKALKPFTQIYVSKEDEDDMVFIDPEKSLIFN